MKLFFLLLLVLSSCQKNLESSYLNYDCIEVENYYTQSVAPILVNNGANLIFLDPPIHRFYR